MYLFLDSSTFILNIIAYTHFSSIVFDILLLDYYLVLNILNKQLLNIILWKMMTLPDFRPLSHHFLMDFCILTLTKDF